LGLEEALRTGRLGFAARAVVGFFGLGDLLVFFRLANHVSKGTRVQAPPYQKTLDRSPPNLVYYLKFLKKVNTQGS